MVFCAIIPKRGSGKLIRASRGPHDVTDCFQEGRLYVLDTGEEVRYYCVKKQIPGPWDSVLLC